MLGLAVVSAVAVTIWLPALFPPKVHSWVIGIVAVITAISEAHFKGLITELQGLMRRSSYSAWQLDQITQVVQPKVKSVWLLWFVSIVMKIVAGIAAAALQWDQLPASWVNICILSGYYLVILSIVIAVLGWASLRNAESLTNRLIQKENETKEKNRLLKELNAGPKHDFESDPAIQSYTKPARQI